ncbi:hypothetical protein [uncultured Ramlibacter sp.]|uniref:hypothetical protein n=1 Tax=uncultured Ramlibacter sp. TaxID=260755 RepID=UPI0026242531|nr:hypothetical protein [uncultured Ramlibacter sp.]
MTDAEFLAWLKSPSALRCALVEAVASVEGVETTVYMSNLGYVTAPTDTPASTCYHPAIATGMEITERLSLDGTPSLSFGDIELFNVDGERDTWLDDIWANREIRVYIGDMQWAREDFRLVFDGITEDIGTRNRDRLNLKVRDKSQRLNTPLTETKLGGATANAERLKPLCFGEVHNIEPLLADPALLKFQVHQGAIERVIETRDNGVVVATTNTLAAGTYVLNQAPVGQITNSVQGDKPTTYGNTIAGLVRRIATAYGADPLDDATEIDDANFDAFDAANTQPVGVYLSDRANVLAVCQLLAGSLGASVVMTALGKLRLVKIELPPPGTPTEVNDANMKEHSLEVAERLPVQAAVKLAYCQNYTVQANLQTGIPAEHKDLYLQPWLFANAADSAVAAAYRISEAPVAQETCLQVTADAQAEAVRRLALRGVPRTIYSYKAFAELMLEELGGAQTITHYRFGMAEGVTGQIVGLVKNWLTGTVTVEVLV